VKKRVKAGENQARIPALHVALQIRHSDILATLPGLASRLCLTISLSLWKSLTT
jgi:hypothetical protein